MYSPTCSHFAKKLKKGLLGSFILISGAATAQVTPPAADSVAKAAPLAEGSIALKTEKKSNWYDRISVKGYLQVRYSRLLETNSKLKFETDKSVGDKGGFLIRRARLAFSGNVHDRVYIYIQPDLAASVSGSTTGNYLQMRDAYADLALDKKKEYRFRIGQSKIPFGFENIQSSSNRLSFERADALNSGVPNERDLGMIFYWAPEKIRARFKELSNHALKGTGDYGVFALGVYNGQTANKNEANNNLHVVSRISYPIAFKNGQIIEPGIQGYLGRYNVGSDQLSSAAVKGGNFDDKRAAASFILYPKPFGFQVEYNVGKSPQFDPETKSLNLKSLQGGYAQASYNLEFNKQLLIPFVKAQYYEGGKKGEIDARFAKTKQLEFGLEWQPFSAFEFTTQYVISDRLTKDGRNLNNHQKGNLLQVQAQFNY